MVFALKKLQLRHEWHAPPLNLLPALSVTAISDATLTALPPLKDTLADPEVDRGHAHLRGGQAAPLAAGPNLPQHPNGVQDSFACLDRAASGAKPDEALRPVPRELQCRYRKGKCSQRRTLKKNGSLHCFCEPHRLRSIRNQKAFDDKRRRLRQRQQQRDEAEACCESQRESLASAGSSPKRPRLATRQSPSAIV